MCSAASPGRRHAVMSFQTSSIFFPRRVDRNRNGCVCDQKAMQTNAEHKRIATHKGAAMATKFCGSYKSCLSTLYASHTLSLAGPYTRDSPIANQNARFYLELTWHPLFYRKLTWQIILASHPSSVRVQVLAVLTTLPQLGLTLGTVIRPAHHLCSQRRMLRSRAKKLS